MVLANKQQTISGILGALWQIHGRLQGALQGLTCYESGASENANGFWQRSALDVSWVAEAYLVHIFHF